MVIAFREPTLNRVRRAAYQALHGLECASHKFAHAWVRGRIQICLTKILEHTRKIDKKEQPVSTPVGNLVCTASPICVL